MHPGGSLNILQIALFGAACAGVVLQTKPASAQEASVSGNIALATDYTVRGVSQTNGSAAVQGGFDVTSESATFYGGAWASNVELGVAQLELDVYGGYRFAAGPISFDVGLVGYLYPDASDDSSEFDYWEGYVKPSARVSEQLTVGGAFYYTAEFSGGAGEGFYAELNGAFAVSADLTLSGAAGIQTVEQTGFFLGQDEYVNWNFGAAYAVGSVVVDVRYIGTDIEGSSLYGERVILSLKKVL